MSSTHKWYRPIAIGSGLCAIAVSAVAIFNSLRVSSAPSGPFAIKVSPLNLPTNPGAQPQALVRLWYPSPAKSNRSYPLLIYFSSWPGTGIDNYHLIRELVSHGYYVASVEYPAQLQSMSALDYERQLAQLQQPMDFSSETAYLRTIQMANERVRQRARDAVRVLDYLTLHHQPNIPPTVLPDLDRVGIFGFSLGGAVASQACWLDQRFKAALNLDGWDWADAVEHGIAQPYLFISGTFTPSAADLKSTDPDRHFNAVLDQAADEYWRNNILRGAIHVTVTNADHSDFTDAPKHGWRRWLTGKTVSPSHMRAILNSYSKAFFDYHLKAQDSPLLKTDTPNQAVKSPFAGATLEIGPRPQ